MFAEKGFSPQKKIAERAILVGNTNWLGAGSEPWQILRVFFFSPELSIMICIKNLYEVTN